MFLYHDLQEVLSFERSCLVNTGRHHLRNDQCRNGSTMTVRDRLLASGRTKKGTCNPPTTICLVIDYSNSFSNHLTTESRILRSSVSKAYTKVCYKVFSFSPMMKIVTTTTKHRPMTPIPRRKRRTMTMIMMMTRRMCP